MLKRLQRPGYWIVLFALLSVYFYRLHLQREAQQRQAAKMQLYRTYGESVLQGLKEGNLTGIQQRFSSGGKRGISLEDIALFVSTLHLDRNYQTRWETLEEGKDNVVLKGNLILEGNVSYPLDMMVVRRGREILLQKLHVGPKTLQLHSESFPFLSCQEGNGSRNPSDSKARLILPRMNHSPQK